MPWFGMQHAAGVLGVILSCLLVHWSGRRFPGSRPLLGLFLTANLLVYIVMAYRVRWQVLAWSTCLPLHLCDLLVLGALLLLCTRGQRGWRRSGFDCVYLWTWVGSIWALITPDLPERFPHYRYFEFFWGHGLLFVVLAHLTATADGLKLRRDSWRAAALGLQLWLLGVGGLNLLFDWNYGYLMTRPPAGSPLDYFGGWPTYVLVADGLGVVLFWLVSRVFGAREEEPDSGDKGPHIV